MNAWSSTRGPHNAARATSRQGWIGLAATGLGLIVLWFAATRTTLLLAYGKASSPLTLSQAQGVCDSGLGLLARNLSAQGSANCSSIDRYVMWLNIAGFAGLLLMIGSVAMLAYRAQHPTAA